MGPVASPSGTPRCSELGGCCDRGICGRSTFHTGQAKMQRSAVGLELRGTDVAGVASSLPWARAAGPYAPHFSVQASCKLQRRGANRMGFCKIAMRGSEEGTLPGTLSSAIRRGCTRGCIGSGAGTGRIGAWRKTPQSPPSCGHWSHAASMLPAPPSRQRGGGGVLLGTVQTECERSRRDPGCRVPSSLAQSTGRSRSASTSPLPPSTFPPSPLRPSSATACRKEEAVAGLAGALFSSVAGEQQSSTHSCTAAPARRSILAGKTSVCPPHPRSKTLHPLPKLCFPTYLPTLVILAPPKSVSNSPVPSQLDHRHPSFVTIPSVEQAAPSATTPILTFSPNTLSTATRVPDAHRTVPGFER